MASSSRLTIHLTPEEDKVATLMVQCAHWIDSNPREVDRLRMVDSHGDPVGPLRGQGKVELRIAGGWVRDKLLGLQSSDIDVSTSPDPLTGLKFATLFEKYLATIGQSNLMGKLTKIEAKPEQSKHLETATAIVCGLSLDWVQLRGDEVYTTESRIPTVSFGTPLEDAERRDLTINSLFYNLHTREVEDQTGNGLADLGIIPGGRRIRTPRSPFQTFRDDPLRVVRAVRFAARFGREFLLDPELCDAVKRPEIRDALKDGKKISRERVGIELEKMLLGNDPLLAMEIIEQLDLHPLIFLYDSSAAFPVTSVPGTPLPTPDSSVALRAAHILTRLSSSPALHPLITPTAADRTTRKRLFLACGLLPLYDALLAERAPLPAVKKRKTAVEEPPPETWRTSWLGERVVLEGIKWPSTEKVWEANARTASVLVADAVRRFGDPTREMQENDRVAIGLLLRNPAVDDMKDQTTWKVTLLWSLIVELTRANPNRHSDIIARYNKFVDRILAFELETRAFAPRLLNGSQVQKLLPTLAKGPAMVGILDRVVEFQLAHPHATEDECRAYLTAPEVIAEIEHAIGRPPKGPVHTCPP